MTMLLPSHLLIDQHRAGTVEWKAMILDAGSPGVSHHMAGLHVLPSSGPNQEASPTPQDSSL